MHSSSNWDSAILSNETRAWFVTTWNGKCAGSASMDFLFAIEIPKSRCIAARLCNKSEGEWKHQITDIASVAKPPDLLITDAKKMLPALAILAASFQKPTSALLDVPITLMPAIERCISKLMDKLNDPAFQSLESVDLRNVELDAWRAEYNEIGRML